MKVLLLEMVQSKHFTDLYNYSITHLAFHADFHLIYK